MPFKQKPASKKFRSLTPEEMNTPDITPPTSPQEESEFKDLSSVDEFLRGIAKNESSNQFNVTHQPVLTSFHKGDQAVGKYGIMPLTVADLMAKREVGQAPEEEQLPVGMDQISSLNPKSGRYHDNARYMADQLRRSPEGQEILARQYATLLLQKYGGDQDRAAYAWTMGPNRNITPQMMDNPDSAGGDYVRKFRKSSAKENPDVPQLEEQSRKKKKFKSLKDK